MHPLLAEKYVTKARAYEVGSDCDPLPGTAEQLAFALVEVSGQRDTAEAMLKRVVKAYEKSVFMRTADMHPVGCDCLRCTMDDAAGLTQKISR